MTSRESFLYFAAIYKEGTPPVMLVDLDGNHELTCDENVPCWNTRPCRKDVPHANAQLEG